MAAESPLSPRSSRPGAADDPLPAVRLELHPGTARAITYDVLDSGFLIGSVPGCDLRLPGAGLPPVIGLITFGPDGVRLRKLAPTQTVLVNGQAASQAFLSHGDRLSLAGVDIQLSIQPAGTTAGRRPARPEEAGVGPLPAQLEAARHQFKQQVEEFRAQVARFQEEQRLLEAEDQQRQREAAERLAQLDARRKQLEEQGREAVADRSLWLRRREEIEQEGRKLQERERELTAATLDLERREQAVEQTREDLARKQASLERRATELDRQQQELAGLRQEFGTVRQQLHDRYRERRDRLAGLEQAVSRAARKVQERKQQLDADTTQAKARHEEQTARQADLDARSAELETRAQQLDEERRLLDTRREDLHEELADRVADVQAREAKLVEERQALEKSQVQHQADLLRLDRLQAALEQRQKQLQERALEIDHRHEQLQRDSRDVEDQARQLDEWQTRVTAEADKLARQKAEQDAVSGQAAQRAAALEGQQAMLATLRTRLERMREDLRREEQQLTDQRVQQEATEADLRQRTHEAQRLRAELDNELQLREQERHQFAQRSALLEAAVSQLRQTQEALARDEELLRQRELALDNDRAQQHEEASLLRARTSQLEETRQRLEADRQAVRDRSEALAQAEQVRAALQEQLRKRSEELAARQKALAEQGQRLEAEAAAVAAQRAEIDRFRQQGDVELTSLRQELDARALELEALRAELGQREETLQRHIERLKEAGRTLGGQRKSLAEERERWQMRQAEEAAALAQARAEFDGARHTADDLQQRLPELEQQGQAAAGKLAQAREQLRGHLAEIHAYVRQSRDDLEAMQAQVQADAERVRQQELALHRAHDEHRLAVAAFRQQLLEWQGQLGEMKQALAQGETRLERREAQVAEQARQVDATSARLARQAEELEQQERLVVERRGEMDRHLEDMREWYRRKLRELAGIDQQAPEAGAAEPSRPAVVAFPGAEAGQGEPVESTPTPGDPQALTPEAPSSILALMGDVDPGDRQLGELLRALDLIDADTLTALLVEARRQRRTLRQILLASGAVTLYQMALIEAGNLDGLVLGPLRVVDRLRATARETVYRVFDPRRGKEDGVSFLLRHLSEAEAEDAVHPDEFRQRFTAAAQVQHPNLAATREVLEIAGRPAVLQEWPAGLPSTDWPVLAAVPGVWFRIISQAALGLHTAHQAGLVHGHLHPSLVVLTGEGVVKLCGLGEPPWLVVPPVMSAEEGNAATDVLALGQLAAAWIAAPPRRKGAKGKSLPESLEAVLARLSADTPEARYDSASALLEDLERAGADVPANAEAWERLLRHVRENAPGDTAFRQSA